MPRWFATRAVARPEFYDRRPLPTSQVYAANLAPAGSTVRLSYTVPTGKKAWVDSVYVSALRVTAAAAAARVLCSGNYTASGGSLSVLTRAYLYNNTPYSFEFDRLAAMGFMGAGDVVTVTTYDENVGGTVEFIATFKYTEFDA